MPKHDMDVTERLTKTPAARARPARGLSAAQDGFRIFAVPVFQASRAHGDSAFLQRLSRARFGLADGLVGGAAQNGDLCRVVRLMICSPNGSASLAGYRSSEDSPWWQ